MTGRRQIYAISRRLRRHAAVLALALLTVPGHSDAQSPVEDPAFDFCVTATETAAARTQCIADWNRAAAQIRSYGKKTGFIDGFGELDNARFYGSAFDWRALVGLPPEEPFLRCLARQAWTRHMDMRAAWDCMKRMDPVAARMDQI